MSKIEHKRGDTFILNCQLVNADGTPVDITGWTIVSKIKTSRYVAIATLTVQVTSAANGTYQITNSDTDGWPAGNALMDVQYTDGSGRITSTETVSVEILREVSGS